MTQESWMSEAGKASAVRVADMANEAPREPSAIKALAVAACFVVGVIAMVASAFTPLQVGALSVDASTLYWAGVVSVVAGIGIGVRKPK